MNSVDRKREVINACLEQFIAKGLNGTSSRDLSNALKLQNGGLYYYFKSKTNVVLACIEEALTRLELNLIIPAVVNVNNPKMMISNAYKDADKLSKVMKFYVSVYLSNVYGARINPIVCRFRKRDLYYIEEISKKLKTSIEEASPLYYIFKSAIIHYLIFGDKKYIEPQVKVVEEKLQEIISMTNMDGA